MQFHLPRILAVDFGAKQKRKISIFALGGLFCLLFALLPFACVQSSQKTTSPSITPDQSEKPAALSNASTLSDESLQEFAKNLEQAFVDKNLAFLETHLAPDASIVVKQNGRTVKVNKARYLALLKKAWSQISDYKYAQSKPVFAIQDNFANLHMVVTESGTVLGRPVRTTVDTTLELRLQNEKITIISVTGQSNMKHD
jgi:cytoskeletal protein RodZ